MLESNLSADLGAANRGGTCVCASLFRFVDRLGTGIMR
jgi:hypothetical protein